MKIKILLTASGLLTATAIAAFGFRAAARSSQEPPASAPSRPAVAEVRISWDFRSRQTMGAFTVADRTVSNRHYPRVKRLKSGDLLMTFMDGRFGWQVFSQRSTDGGATWSAPIWVKKSYKDAAANDSVAYCNPDFLQLTDGSVLMAYQRRNNRRSNENEGIEVMRSTDEGKSWGAPAWAFRGKNWEPSLLQLPSGEVQLLFTDTRDDLCHVGMLRSHDNGKTWTPAPDVQKGDANYLSRTAGETPDGTPFSMDGMAVGTALKNGRGIVYIAECDLVGKKIMPDPVTPSIVWSSLEKNWRYGEFHAPMSGPADRRWPVYPGFRGFAPYLTQLDTGEVLVQSNGKLDGTGGMWTFIGDPTAHQFASPSRPFGTLGFWGCLTQIAPDRVLSGITTGAKGKERILLEQGILNRPLVIASAKSAGTPSASWFIGDASQAQGRLTARDSGDSLTLDFTALDNSILASAGEPEKSDGFRLSWTKRGLSDRQYRITTATSGDAFLESRPATDKPWTRDSTLVGKLEKDGKVDSYHLTVTIPWKSLGGKPSADTKASAVAAHLELFNRDAETPFMVDSMPGEDPDNPETWLGVRLAP